MDKAYNAIDWEDRPSTASPLDEINLDAISQGLSTVDDRVISIYDTLQESVSSITINETTGLITITENNGQTYGFNLATRIYNTIAANQQAATAQFGQISRSLGSVDDMLAAMDLKIDLNAETANDGLTALRTTVTQNDGYYRQEMSGLSQSISDIDASTANAINGLRNDITTYQSSITQTTQAIQLSVQSVTQSVDTLSTSTSQAITSLQAQINVTAGDITLKVSKMEIIDGLQEEFGSGIQITPDQITFASTGALVVNTTNFKLDEDGNAEFTGTVYMESGYVGGYPIVTYGGDDPAMTIEHASNAWKLRSAWSANDALTDRDEFTTDGTNDTYYIPNYDANPDYVFVALWKITGTSTYTVVDPSLYSFEDRRGEGNSSIYFHTTPPAGENYQLCYKVRFYVMLTKNGNLVGTTNATAGHDTDANDATEKIDIGYHVHPFRAGYFHKVVPGANDQISQVGLANRPFHEGYFENLYVNGEPVGPGGGGGGGCIKKEATLLAANWDSNNRQVLTVSGIKADETKQCIMIAAQGQFPQSFIDAQILVVAQGNNSLTFQCTRPW